MKRIILLLTFSLLIQIAYSQSINKIVGVYHLQSGSHDPQGGVNLILTADNQYVFAYFGGMNAGTWKECDGNLIMQPDTTNQDAYYVSARNNPEILADSIYISFGGISEALALCGFGHSGENTTMHPVYNKYPNCMREGRVGLKKSKYDEFSLMSAPTVYEDIEYDTDETDWKDALMNYLKDKNLSIEDTDTIRGIKYTFPLSASYNEYQILYNPTGDRFLFPSLGIFQDNKLHINNSVYRKSGDLNSLSDGDKKFIEQLSSVVAQRPGMSDFEDGELSRSRMEEAGFSKEDIEEYLLQSSTPKYKPILHIRKEKIIVDYDLNNIITNTCYDITKSKRKSYLY